MKERQKGYLALAACVVIAIASAVVGTVFRHAAVEVQNRQLRIPASERVARRVVRVDTTYVSGYWSGDHRAVIFDYDEDGKLVQKCSGDTITTYLYDADGRILEIDYPGGFRSVFTYDENGLLIHERSCNDSNEDGLLYTTDYRYDDTGRIVSSISTRGFVRESAENGFPSYTETGYFYQNDELVRTDTNNLTWYEQAREDGVNWAKRVLTSVYYYYLDPGNSLCERHVKTTTDGQKSQSGGFNLLDPAGTDITDIVYWEGRVDIERDEHGYIVRVTAYGEEGEPEYVETVTYEDVPQG